MKAPGAVSVLLLILSAAPEAHSCSCLVLTGAPEAQVQQAHDDADFVFVARLLRSSLKPDRRDRRLVVEEAQFTVREVFKGALRKGQVIRVRQVLSAGTCAQSSRNDPPWMYSQDAAGEIPKPLELSKEWLVYAHGAEPFELSRCTRSAPMNFEGGEDVKILRQYAKKAALKH